MRSNYIGGNWTSSASDLAIDVLNPATEQVIDQVPAGHEADVDEAVRSLHAAFFVDPDPEIFDVSARKTVESVQR